MQVRDHCHITGKYRGTTFIDCNINVKSNHAIYIVLHNLKNHNSHLIIQEKGKLIFKVNVIPNGLEKYMNVNISSKLNFIDSF